MRSLVFLSCLVIALGAAVPFPFAGVLLWTWFSLQAPHEEVFGFVQSAPINLVIAVVTIAAWFASHERKLPRLGIIGWTIVMLLAWMALNGFFAFDPSWSWTYWDRTWKTFVLGLVVASTATNRVRVHALLWIIVVSLFYFGVKGGLFTLVTAGQFRVQGPLGTIISDNNQLAVALLMTLPFAYYLYGQSTNIMARCALLLGIVFSVVAILGTYSRGALIGLVVLSFLVLMRVRRKITYMLAAGVMIAFAIAFMPQQYFTRMQTIDATSTDASFQGRVAAWNVAWMYARDHFPFGAGFYGPQLPDLFHLYFPDEPARAAHSIYFQVLGEQGFIGLALYLVLLAAALMRCSRLVSTARKAVNSQWLAELGVAIQTSILVFCTAAAALSMAYYDLLVVCVALLLPLSDISGRASGFPTLTGERRDLQPAAII